MKSLLVFAAFSAVAVNSQLLYAGYPYAAPVQYTYTPQVIKPVIKEVEIPVEHLTYGIAETGCKNVFGFPVPCLQEGEARKRRDADDEPAAETPAATVPLAYAGYPFGAYAYGAYPYAAYGAYPYAYAAPAVKIAEPEVTEVEVPAYVYKPVVKQVDLPPLCHNGWGIAVPCA